MKKLQFFLLFGICVATVSQVIAGPKPGNPELLFKLDRPSNEAAARASKDLGRILGKDEESGMYIVRLSAKSDIKKAEEALKKKPGVSLVLPESARTVDRSSLTSVENHMRYLKASWKGKDDDGDDMDYWGSLDYYLKSHVAAGSDRIDIQALKNALAHKARMPLGHIGGPGALTNPTYGNWTFIGPQNLASALLESNDFGDIIGRISCLAYDPTTSSTIYAGSGGGGIWKTTNAGTNWTCITDKAPWVTGSVGAIAIDPANHLTLYVGTGDFVYADRDSLTQGIMKSTDGGNTWTNLTPNPQTGLTDCAVSNIVIDPDNDQIILCSTGKSETGGIGNVFRSTDGGATWAPAGLPGTDYSALDVSIKNGSGVRTFWAAGTSPAGTAAPLYYSTDEGKTWTKATPPENVAEGDWSVACSKVDAGKLYAMSPREQTIYVTTNKGGTWTNIGANLPVLAKESIWKQDTYDYFLGTIAQPQAPSGELLFCGLITLYFTDDGGTTWNDFAKVYETGALTHPDQHCFAISPTDPTQCLDGNDGGVWRMNISWSDSTPTVTMTSLNATLGITQYYHIAPHPTDPDKMLGGAQDNSSPSALGSLANWQNPGGSDGGCCDWMVPLDEFFTSYQFGNVYVFDASTLTETHIGASSSATVGFIAPIVLAADGNSIYVGTSNLLQCDLLTTPLKLKTVSPALTTNYVNAIGIAPSDTGRIYTGGVDGEIFMTANATAGDSSTWTEIDTSALPSGVNIGAVSVNPANENDVLVGYQNTGTLHLYQCLNPTAAKPTWTAVGGTGDSSLPDQPVHAILRDPYSPTTTWYVGTAVGVFMTTNSGATWTDVTGALPNTEIYDLKAGAGFLYAGTYGRGAWRISLPAPEAYLVLTTNPATLVGNSSATGTITLANAPGGDGAFVSLASSSTLVSIPYSVYVAPNATSAQIGLTVSAKVTAPTPVTLTAALGSEVASAEVTVDPQPQVSSVSFTAAQVAGGNTAACTVKLLAPAPQAGLKVTLSSSSPSAVVPASEQFESGVSSVSFTVTTSAVTSGTVATISATAGGVTKAATLTINPVSPVSNVYLEYSSIPGGTAESGTLYLDATAPPGGEQVTVSSPSSYVTTSGTVTVAAGSNSTYFNVYTKPVTSSTPATVSVSAGGITKSVTLTINPAAVITGFTLSANSVTAGGTVTGTVTIATAAPTSGQEVLLSSNLPGAATVPTYVKVASGKTAATFTISAAKTVSKATVVTLSATSQGVTKYQALTVNP